jgi:hypothetical protein
MSFYKTPQFNPEIPNSFSQHKNISANKKNGKISWVFVTHDCNPNYSGGRYQGSCGSKQTSARCV